MSITVNLTENDRNDLERAHYMVESIANLINRMTKNNSNTDENFNAILEKYLKEYANEFMNYEKLKSKIGEKYRPEDMLDTASWSVNFEISTITYQV